MLEPLLRKGFRKVRERTQQAVHVTASCKEEEMVQWMDEVRQNNDSKKMGATSFALITKNLFRRYFITVICVTSCVKEKEWRWQTQGNVLRMACS